MQAWIEEMSAFIRRLDKNHLIAVGDYGFFGAATPDKLQYNPATTNAFASMTDGSPFVYNALCEGSDFLQNHAAQVRAFASWECIISNALRARTHVCLGKGDYMLFLT
jgi:hypothetical protein